MRFDFLGLQAFLSIAERGSFQRAAAHLNLSQTALSHRMRKLEADLGVKLFTRTTRHVALSPAGLDLLPKARRILTDIATALDELREHGRGSAQRIAIGCLPTIAIHYLPRLLREFSALHPGMAVKVFDNSASEIAAHVHSGAAEFGITIVSANGWDLEIKPLLKESFVLVCPADHDFARQRSVRWTELAATPLVRISQQTGNRALIDDALGSRRESLDWRYEVQHVATAVSMVLAGVGMTVVPRLAVDVMGTPGIAAVPLERPRVSRTIGILSRRGVPLSPAAESLAELIRKHLRTGR